MARIVVFQHVAAEPLGTLDALIRARGHRIRFVNFERDPTATIDVTRYDGLIVLGGPMMVSDRHRLPHLETEITAISRALDADLPVLGICLGAQLLAHVLGADVGPLPQPEIGWYPLSPTNETEKDPVLGSLAQTSPIFQWHGHGFDLPRDAVHLASTPNCPNQAFRYGNAYGFQFHLEMDRALIHRWLHLPSYQAELKHAAVGGVDQIQADTERHLDGMNALADTVFNPLLDRFGPPRPRVALPSR